MKMLKPLLPGVRGRAVERLRTQIAMSGYCVLGWAMVCSVGRREQAGVHQQPHVEDAARELRIHERQSRLIAGVWDHGEGEAAIEAAAAYGLLVLPA